MHPIAASRSNFAIYVLAWLPLAALLVYLFWITGLPMETSALFMLPLSVLFALMCLAAWYPCRATPIQSSKPARLFATQITAAVVVSSLWTLCAWTYGYALGTTERFRELRLHFGIYEGVFSMGVLIYLLWAASYYVIISLEKSREAEASAQEARLLARDAELRALKAQINPHFLFNSLHSISALTSIDPAKAREMCITLADFLRRTLGLGEKPLVPLAEEVELLRRFLAIEKIRFGARLQVQEQIDPDALDCLLPPLLLQPLFENAITHGIANLTEGGSIRMSVACCNGTQLSIEIENNFDPEYRPKRSRGIGVANVRDRLETRYGKDATFAARVEGDRYYVSMILPAERSTPRE